MKIAQFTCAIGFALFAVQTSAQADSAKIACYKLSSHVYWKDHSAPASDYKDWPLQNGIFPSVCFFPGESNDDLVEFFSWWGYYTPTNPGKWRRLNFSKFQPGADSLIANFWIETGKYPMGDTFDVTPDERFTLALGAQKVWSETILDKDFYTVIRYDSEQDASKCHHPWD